MGYWQVKTHYNGQHGESAIKPRSRVKHIHENLPDALTILLRELGIAHTSMLLQQLKGHPTFPSLHALSEVLIQAGIQNVAAQLSYEDLLDKAPLPAVANVKGGTEYNLFFVLRAVNEQGVKLLDGEGKEILVPKARFSTDWTGLVLLCDPGKTQKEHNYWQHRIEAWFRGYRARVLGVVLLLLIGLSFSLHSTALMGYPLLHLVAKGLDC